MYKKYVASALLVFIVLFSYQTAHASFLGDVWGGLKTVVSGNHQNLGATVVGGTKLAPIATPPIVEPAPSTTVLDTIPTDTTTPPILVPTKPCTITAFSATPSAISVGDTTSLSWKTTNCTSATLDGATVATTGTQSTGVLSASKTYTLVARARESVQSLKTTVTVNPVITPTTNQDSTTTTPVVNPQQTPTTSTTSDTTPRIAYWWGKVNQHIDTQGNWQTDTDGWSGASLDELTYCKKFYPNTTSVAPYKSETITTFRRASGYEQSGYTNTVTSVQCVQNGIVVTTPVVNTSPTTPILTSPTNDEPIPHTPRTIESGATGNDVKDIQTKLKEQGFLTAKPSGSFGAKTKSAVKKFQKANDLPVTGIVDQATLDTLSGTAARQGSGTPVITPNPIPNPTTVLCSITNLSAKPAVITTGSSSVISWSTTGCSKVTLDGISVGINGSQNTGALAPMGRTYTLIATSKTGTQTKSITVVVKPSPSINVGINGAFPNQIINSNTNHNHIGSFIIQNQNSSEDIKITSINLGLYTDKGLINQLTATTIPSIGNFSGITITGNNTGSSFPIVLSNNGNTFITNFVVTAGSVQVIDVWADAGSVTGQSFVTGLSATGVMVNSNGNVATLPVAGQIIKIQ